MNEFYNRQFYIRIIMNESCLSHCNKNIEHLNLKFCKKKILFFFHMIVIDMTILQSPLGSEKRVFFV